MGDGTDLKKRTETAENFYVFMRFAPFFFRRLVLELNCKKHFINTLFDFFEPFLAYLASAFAIRDKMYDFFYKFNMLILNPLKSFNKVYLNLTF
jgi:hypothetical protein